MASLGYVEVPLSRYDELVKKEQRLHTLEKLILDSERFKVSQNIYRLVLNLEDDGK